MELNILLYTHTDYKDAWAPFFGQINKFLPDLESGQLSTCDIYFSLF